MANRTIKDRIWVSDKLAQCSLTAELHYPRLYLLADDWSCFEIDLPVIVGRVYPKRPKVQAAQVSGWLDEYTNHGLLFRWSDGRAEYGYFTGDETGRLPAPTRRHQRHTPEPPPEALASYLGTYKSLQGAYKSLQTDYPNPLSLEPNPYHHPLGDDDCSPPGPHPDWPQLLEWWEGFSTRPPLPKKVHRETMSEISALLASLGLERMKAIGDECRVNGEALPNSMRYFLPAWREAAGGGKGSGDDEMRRKAYACFKKNPGCIADGKGPNCPACPRFKDKPSGSSPSSEAVKPEGLPSYDSNDFRAHQSPDPTDEQMAMNAAKAKEALAGLKMKGLE